MAAVALVGLLLALIAPNLSSLLPSARLTGSGKALVSWLRTIRSEARIQAKRMEMELDLDRACYRIVWPPEERLTSDQIIYEDKDIPDSSKDWIDLDDNVVFAGAGDAAGGLATKGVYRVAFDEYGFSADQIIALQLEQNPEFVWTLSLRGLTGEIETTESVDGEIARPQRVGEGAFQ